MALAFYFINLILQFFSRKIFLDYLGAEVLGLNTTATNLLQFLNLAELGVGAAIACTLYKPLAEKDTDTINEIVSLQGWLYRRIAWIVIAGSVVLMAFSLGSLPRCRCPYGMRMPLLGYYWLVGY